jgi:predicted signal transduction protein with EAL and GGDEF domain
MPRLEHCPDSDSTLARLGGDEFTVLLENIRDASDAVRVAECLLETIAAPVRLEGADIFTTASIGIAVSSSGQGGGEELVRDADTAMYRAKAAGGNRYAVFDATMHRGAVQRLQLETALRRAIERDEFGVHYQPIVRLGDSRLTGFEALVRWNHPEQGCLSPAAFIHIAEDTGLIAHIDRAVLRAACRAARQWHTQFPLDSPLTVSVNISARSFAQPDLVRHVTRTLQETGLEPRCLRLEITEGAAMADAERARAVLMDLKSLGVGLSLDDFGTGFSSLSYLQRFPVDTLKIDQSFIARIDQHDCREIIRTMLNLARTLRLDVVAEGMETSAQVDFLESLDCGFGQGYFFSRPIPADAVDRLLERLEDGYGSLVPRSTAVVPMTGALN